MSYNQYKLKTEKFLNCMFYKGIYCFVSTIFWIKLLEFKHNSLCLINLNFLSTCCIPSTSLSSFLLASLIKGFAFQFLGYLLICFSLVATNLFFTNTGTPSFWSNLKFIAFVNFLAQSIENTIFYSLFLKQQNYYFLGKYLQILASENIV